MTNRTFKAGVNRDQPSFLPPCLDDYVGRDHPVRAIDAYVDALDLEELGFRHPGSDGGAGQPPYHPGDLLKLYMGTCTGSARRGAWSRKHGAMSS